MRIHTIKSSSILRSKIAMLVYQCYNLGPHYWLKDLREWREDFGPLNIEVHCGSMLVQLLPLQKKFHELNMRTNNSTKVTIDLNYLPDTPRNIHIMEQYRGALIGVVDLVGVLTLE